MTKLGSKATESLNTVVDDDAKVVSSGASANSPAVDPYELYKNMTEVVNETVKLIQK
ncbi:hypothetical protein D3C86_2143510 [compost metagenome]